MKYLDRKRNPNGVSRPPYDPDGPGGPPREPVSDEKVKKLLIGFGVLAAVMAAAYAIGVYRG